MSAAITEFIVESAVLDWFRELGWATVFGPDLAFDGPRPERANDAVVGHGLLPAKVSTFASKGESLMLSQVLP